MSKKTLLTLLVAIPASALVFGLIALAFHDSASAGIMIAAGLFWDLPLYYLYKRTQGKSGLMPKDMAVAEIAMLVLGLIAGAIYLSHR